MRELRGLAYLTWLTFKRQATGRKMVVAVTLLFMLCLVTILWARRNAVGATADAADLNRSLRRFTRDVLFPVYVSFLLPILTVVFATGAIGDEREDRTLIHLLIRPLARFRIYLAKGLGVLPIVLATTVGGLLLLCWCAGGTGEVAFRLFWPGALRACLAYTSLFLLVGALLPRPVVLSVVYVFFVETLLGNTPGTIKRLAISYHTRCVMYDAASPLGLTPDKSLQFLPISGDAAARVLDLVALVLLVLGAWAFHRKEYRDLE